MIFRNIAILLCCIIILPFFSSCMAQQSKKSITREPVAAGKFYPSDKRQLQNQIASLFSNANNISDTGIVRAIIVPHAGYVFSGEIAAAAIKLIDREKIYDNIFIIGSSHTTLFSGASIYNLGNYKTPLGQVRVNTILAQKLIDDNKVFRYFENAHKQEHSIEVELPLLQYWLRDTSNSIIPIIIGGEDLNTSKQVAQALQPYFNQNNLFIISSDFSHYPNHSDACIIDSITLQSILSKDPQTFIATLQKNAQKQINNLATSCCGHTSVLALLYLVNNNQIQFKHLAYKNSGDTPYSGKDRVVGYHSIAAIEYPNLQTQLKTSSMFSKDDKIILLQLARNTIQEYITKGNRIDVKEDSEALQVHCGSFVTLHKDGKLRGCIGQFTANKPIYKLIVDMAIAAATEDHRFLPVKEDEIKDLEIEISILSPMKKINSIDEIQLGIHGIYIIKGMNRGTFLPQVATQTGWNLEQFLGHCSRDKAGIGWEGWKSAEIYTYKATIFSEKELLK